MPLSLAISYLHGVVQEGLVLGGEDGDDLGSGEELLDLEQHLAGEDGGEYPGVLRSLLRDS